VSCRVETCREEPSEICAYDPLNAGYLADLVQVQGFVVIILDRRETCDFGWRRPFQNGSRPNSTWLVTSRHVSTRQDTFYVLSAPRRERWDVLFDTSTQPKYMGSTRRKCRVVSRGEVTSQVEFVLMCRKMT